MYRRNISPLLYKVAIVVTLIILYGAWLKPTYLHHVPPPLSDSPPSEKSPASGDASNLDANEPLPKQTRTIDPSVVPETRHHDMLAEVRDELEKGNLQLVESKLANAPSKMASDPAVRPYLAILWNNLGIEQEKIGGTQISVHTFKKAASLDPKNSVILLNLAHAYWELRDPAMNLDFLEHLITLAPDEPFPHLAMADYLREHDRLREAARHLDHATDRSGKDPAVQSYLRTVSAKIKRTEDSEDRLTRRDSTHFTVKFDGQADPDTWIVVQEILEEAYREIGQKFGHFPSKPITVVLQTKSEFQSETGSPLWADGLFDSVLGRIQIPTEGATTDRAWLTRVLRHEFSHALLHDLLGLGSTAIPTWLNEGLAMQLSGETWSGIQPAQGQDWTFIPLTALEGAWGHLPPETAAMAYVEANSAVHYMIERFGQHSVNQLLTHLKARQSLNAAIQSQLSMSYEQFESGWKDRFNGELKRG
ncbi:putative TPR repeat protein [Nitrospira sp. KM1]|nr:putative TPR repeat protein [Nitrospira sp. KM1]